MSYYTPPTLRLGLSHLAENPLLTAARALNAPLLISANYLAVKSIDERDGPIPKTDLPLRRAYMRFDRFRPTPGVLRSFDVALDAGGYVAARCYGDYLWSPEAYIKWAASFPYTWITALDYACERELAPNGEAVLRRIAQTVNLYQRCRRTARDYPVNLIPVLQGWRASDYLRCADLMLLDATTPLVGIGSVCRRHRDGPDGLLTILDTLDRALDPTIRFHLFGVKQDALAAAWRHWPNRIFSSDSQAWDMAARRDLYRRGMSKTQAHRALYLTAWYRRQQTLVDQAIVDVARDGPAQITLPFYPAPAEPDNAFERIYRAVRDEHLALIAAGEMSDLNQRWIYEEAGERFAQLEAA